MKALRIFRGMLLALALIVCVIVWIIGLVVVGYTWPIVGVIGLISIFGVALIDLVYLC